MRTGDWLTSLRPGWVRAGQQGRSVAAGRRRTAGRFDLLEPRVVLALDFGDAPDTGAGTGAGNYETIIADGGPRHTIVAGLRLGATVDAEVNAAQTALANGDDITTSPDDEDGVVNPQVDLLLTTGTQPTVALRATNTRSTAATLSGWIDFNNNGVFDNASERAQVNVPTATNNGLFTLTFPVVPIGFTGTTYARFRLSTDVAGSNPTGVATTGEVEDYAVTITTPSGGTVKTGGATLLANGGTNLPVLGPIDYFGTSVANLGDLDGDGFADLAVGARGNSFGPGYGPGGAVHILFLSASGTVISSKKIAGGTDGVPSLADTVRFGAAVANLGDLDGDGVTDLAVGDTKGNTYGAVHILFLNANGTVKSSTKIASGTNGGPILDGFSPSFGCSLASLGDLDGDGVTDLAVGAYLESTTAFATGAVHILFLNASGTVKSSTRISSGTGGGPTLVHDSNFGTSLANIGDLDGDGVADLAVGAYRDAGTLYSGAVYVLLLNASGTAKSSTKIDSLTGGGPPLASHVEFGHSVANVGDQDGDGVNDLAVGSTRDDRGGYNRGALHILFLNSSGTVKGRTKIGSGIGGGPVLSNSNEFGRSVANMGDLDGDGRTDLAVGANGDSESSSRGAVHILRLGPNAFPNLAPTALSLAPGTVAANAPVGTAIGNFTTTDPDNENTFTYTFAAGSGSTDNASFAIVGNQLRSNTLFNVLVKSSYSIRVRTTDQGNLSFEQTFTINVTNANRAPSLDNSGDLFTVLGVGARQSTEMRQGTLVSDLLAHGAGGNPISDPDAGALRGIALTNVNQTLGNFQFTLVTNNPVEADWVNVDLAGAVANTNALLLPSTARLRFSTGRIPHHAFDPQQFLTLGQMLNNGMTFRAWDQTSGSAGGRVDTSINGGTTAFSTALETSKVYFEARLFRHFNSNAQLNVYTLEAEFNALAGRNNPAFEDRSTDAWTGFTVLLSEVPELATTPLYRMYYGVQFNANGTQTDMGYRYLTTNLIEAQTLEDSGPADRRPQRAGTYFRELGVNAGSGILGYIYTTQQPGTQQMRQIYRTDIVQKPTRPAGTNEGGLPTSSTPQENGDHVYTTNTAFESTKTGTWRVEDPRGFVRPLGGSGIIAQATSAGAIATPITRAASVITVGPTKDLFHAAATGNTFTATLPTSLNTTSAALNPDHVSTTIDVGLIAPTVPAVQPQTVNDQSNPKTTETAPTITGELIEVTSATDDLFTSLGSTTNDLCPW